MKLWNKFNFSLLNMVLKTIFLKNEVKMYN